MINEWLSVKEFSSYENLDDSTLRKRITKGIYNGPFLRKVSKLTGGYAYEIHNSMLSISAQLKFKLNTQPAQQLITKQRKERNDKGKTKADFGILNICAAIVTNARASYEKKLNKNFGYKKGFDEYMKYVASGETDKITYRRFIDLTKPLVDKQVQKRINLTTEKYKQSVMCLRNDYSDKEPMQLLEQDHTQFDVMCYHKVNPIDRKVKLIRPWASFHMDVGTRRLSYPSIAVRPDSYSMADDLAYFVMQNGLSQKEVQYFTDNGRAQKSRIMHNGEFMDVELKSYDLVLINEKVRKLMNMGLSHEKGIVENLGMIGSFANSRAPQEKVIERAFGVGGTMEWFVDRPEYTGRRYQEKPEALNKNIKKGNIWTSEEMAEFVMDKVDEYNNRFHSAIKEERKGIYAIPLEKRGDLEFFQSKEFIRLFGGLKVETMGEVIRLFHDETFSQKVLGTNLYSPNWVAEVYNKCGWQSRALPAKETLAMLAMGHVERTVHPYGIEINNNHYINLALQKYSNPPQRVICRYHPSKIVRIKEQSGKEKLFFEEIYVFEKKTENFICIAEPHPYVTRQLVASGYTKEFNNKKGIEFREVSKAAKITSEIAAGKYEEIKRQDTLVFQLQTTRDIAAKKLELAKLEKTNKHFNKAKEDEEDIRIAESIFGRQIEVGGEE